VTSIQPELRVDRGAEAVAFYQAAFGATVLTITKFPSQGPAAIR